jgi:hypothetical protein
MKRISFVGMFPGEVDIQFNEWFEKTKPTQMLAVENGYNNEIKMFYTIVLYSNSMLMKVNQ